MVIFDWILVTVVLSAIIGIFFTSFAVYIKKTKRKSDSVFWQSFFGGLLGGLLGSIIGCIVGAIITPKGDDLFLGLSAFGEIMFFVKVFKIFWISCTIIGATLGGLRYLEKDNS